MNRLRLALPLASAAFLLTACPEVKPPNNQAICEQEPVGLAVSATSLTADLPSHLLSHLPSSAPTSPAPNWAAPHVPGEVVVSGSPAALSAQSLSALALSVQGLSVQGGLQVQQLTPEVLLVRTPAGQTDRAFAQTLQGAGLNTQPNFLYPPLAAPNDPGYPGNGGISVENVNITQTYLTRIRAQGAWTFLAGCGKTPVAATTALADTAVFQDHPDLAGRISSHVSFLEPGEFSTYGHGTASAGVMAAKTNNQQGLAGITWSGRIIALEVLHGGGGSTASLTQALDYAVKQGAKVVNLSVGVIGHPGDAALDKALNNAEKTAVVVAAAGNSSGDGVYYPASHPGVLAVGAVGHLDSELACYSARPNAQRTRPLDIVAPGGGGWGRCVGATSQDELVLLAPGGEYVLNSGTSFAAPMVSAVAALMRGANPALTAAQTRTLLLESVNTTSGLPLLDANAAIRAATR